MPSSPATRTTQARLEQPFTPALLHPHAVPGDEVLQVLQSSRHGLSRQEAMARLERFGRNTLPRPTPPGLVTLILRQFLSPLIYILLFAAVLSVALQEWSDAIFIFAVLLINAIIGTIQEYSAERSAEALQQLVALHTPVLREGDVFEIDAEELVPGDVVLLESGSKVPADLRLILSQGLEIDESLLTGESLPAPKSPEVVLNPEAPLAWLMHSPFR